MIISFEWATSLWKQSLTKKSKEGSSYSRRLKVLLSNLKVESMWLACVVFYSYLVCIYVYKHEDRVWNTRQVVLWFPLLLL
jgi:hypothetical protein